MTIAISNPRRDSRTEAADNAAAARTRRIRLVRVLWGSVVLIAIAVGVAFVLPQVSRRPYTIAICVGLAFCGALPLLASLIQYTVIGLHRYRIGYENLRSYYPRVAIVVPAWNEAEVIGTTIERLLSMEYPEDRVRVYVVDDASTDATPDIVRAWHAREPARVWHLRREKGGQGKAHTLNHGIEQVLADPWAEAVLIIDADVLFEDSALRRMTRHLSDPAVGAVTGYIKEGTADGNYLTRYIAYEYITAQAAARRAQNIFGSLACLAGGAQLHSRENLTRIGGAIDTSSLAEDTFTTFRTQLSGKIAVFEGNAVVWAEEPGDLGGLWKQRLRWARGNVQISLDFSSMWLRGRKYGNLGRALFALIWFSVLLMPLSMIAASVGLLGLLLIDARHSLAVFRVLWILHAVLYLFETAMAFALDPPTARRAWAEAILFPGVVSLVIIIYSVAPEPIGALFVKSLEGLGVDATPRVVFWAQAFAFTWLTVAMLVAYIAKWIAARWRARWLPAFLLQVAGYGAFLCAVTFAAYVREIQGARIIWDKTIKTGKVALPR